MRVCRFGSLKYMHHFGLGSFSYPAEHWNLQASLPHSSSDAFFPLSLASAFEFAASALASEDLRGTGFVGDKIVLCRYRKLHRFFSLEISALRASGETESKKHSE